MMVKYKGSGSPILKRDYGLVLEMRGGERGGGSKIYLFPTNFLFGRALRTGPGKLKNILGMDDCELNEFGNMISKREGSKNLINTYHSEAILGNLDNKKSFPEVKNEYLSGAVKSKKRGWYGVNIKRPFISYNSELLLNDVVCGCDDKIHSTKKGGKWSSDVVCIHSSTLWDDLAEYLKRRESGNENLYGKKGWLLNEPLRNDLFIPFTFMEYDERGESSQGDRLLGDLLKERYLNGENFYDMDREMLKNPHFLTDGSRNLIERGDIKFELIQQDRKKENGKNDHVNEKANMAKNIDRKLKSLDMGFYRSGKTLEEGLPSDRYELPEKDLAINVVYSEEFPPFLAVKKLKGEVKMDGNDSDIEPYKYMGATLKDRVDDKTRRVADVRYSTPNKILWPNISKSRGNDIEIPPIIEEMSRDAIEKYSKFSEYSLRMTDLIEE
ncbi:MAG: hypothetical protein ABEK36_06140 [Candidatus Aenigmatarchaeota archaeon]